jgi:hypothetical protein
MRRLTIVAAAGLAVAGLAGCSQVAQLQPVAGDAEITVRAATIDVALSQGLTFKSAPTCEYSGTHFTCQGLATDGRAVIGEADQYTTPEVPQQFQADLPKDAAAADKFIVIKVTAGDATLYQGLTGTIMEQNARTAQ